MKGLRATISLLAWSVVCSDLLALDPARALTQYGHDVWMREQGLPQNSVEAITQSADGYLWVGTQEGLARFDGVRFEVFDRKTTGVLEEDNILALLADPAGTLWIGTSDGLYTYFDGLFTRITPAGEKHGVRAIHRDRQGVLWLGLRDGVPLSVLHGDDIEAFKDLTGATLRQVSSITEKDDGSLCFAAKDVQCLTGGRFVAQGVPRLLPGLDVPETILFHGPTGLWVGTVAGTGQLAVDHARRWTSADGLPGDTGSAMHVDSHGVLWIGTVAGGVSRFHAGRFESFTERQGLSSGQVKALYEDREGSLWIGTNGGGLNRLRDRRFEPLSVQEGLSHRYVHSVLQGRGGEMWIGTAEGLNRLEDGRVTAYGRQQGLASEVVMGLMEDRGGTLWVGTAGGVDAMREGRLRHYASPAITVSLHEDTDGEIWAGALDGVYRLRGGRFEPVASSRTVGFINAIVDDGSGGVWLGSFNGGMVHHHAGSVDRLTTAEGLSSDKVLALHVDTRGVVWIATYGGGLNRLEGGRVTWYTTAQGLPSDNIFQILEDHFGRLWMSTNHGIFSVEKARLDQIAAGGTGRVEATLYGTGDGMRNDECNGGQQPAGWKSRDGALWFPTVDGLVRIDPANLRPNQVPPPVQIERVVAEGIPHDVTRTRGDWTLPAGTRRLEFHYTALSLIAPGKVRFRYRLDGFDRTWVEAEGRRTAFYTNIPPGGYSFRLAACNNDGVWNEAGTSLAFVLAPHFYQTIPFYAMCTLALALAGYAVHRRRLARALELEKVRTRIATDLHDDIGASLSQIAILSEVVRRRLDGSDASVNEPLSRIAASSRELVDAMGDIVWAVNPKRDRLRDITQRMRRFASETLGARGMEISFSAPADGEDLPIGVETKRHLHLILKESVNNAARHSGASRVEVALEVSRDRLELQVHDNGGGFDPTRAGEGHGLDSMRRRARDLGGILEIRSAPDRGTTVRADVPLRGKGRRWPWSGRYPFR